jgi:catechol 2,3-dioxygenase-like lactoylglutathione lyase family enzyme
MSACTVVRTRADANRSGESNGTCDRCSEAVVLIGQLWVNSTRIPGAENESPGAAQYTAQRRIDLCDRYLPPKVTRANHMTAQLNHTIVYSSDRTKSARFLAAILGRPAPFRFGPFEVVELDNGVSLDFAATDGPIQPQHYAFLISEAEFDAVFGRIQEQGIQYWADPRHSRPGEINHNDGGRGVYFPDPDGHYLEVITRPYGRGSS